ncbi:MAG: hypothetical protein V1721_09035 [Pseudomonadota bacterium]
MQKPLAQIFNEMAAAAHKVFPEELENLVVFLLSSSDPVIYAAPEIAKHLANNPAAVKKAVEQATNYMSSRHIDGIAERDYPLAGDFVSRIALYENPDGICFSRYTEEMRAISRINHEIGHLVVENGYAYVPASKHLADCAADAYAALRHIQQFGKETDYFEYYSFAHAAVFGNSTSHYTDDVIQRVKQLSEETDISRLSLRETAELAGKIALEYSLNEKTLKKISTAFSPVADAYKKAGGLDDTVLRKCIEVMREHKDDPDIFKAGARFLNYPSYKEGLENKAKTDPYWRNALDFIKNHQTKPVKKTLHPRSTDSVMKGR